MTRTEKHLRPSQLQAIAAFEEFEEQVVRLDMGGGKTAATLHALVRLHREGAVRGGVIVAPPLVAATVWPREPVKWASLSGVIVAALVGTPAQRLRALRKALEAQIFGSFVLLSVSTALLPWLAECMRSLPDDHPFLDALVIDELSMLKDPRSKRVKEAFKSLLRFKSRYGLTGTLRPNGYEDLWNPLRVISGGRIWDGEAFDDWRRARFMPLDKHGYQWRIHTFARAEIDRKVARYVTPIEVDLDLPGLNAGLGQDYQVELGENAQRAYRTMLADHLSEVTGLPMAEITRRLEEGDKDLALVIAQSAAVASGKLAQIAQGFLYDRVVDPDGEREPHTEVVASWANPKIEAVRTIRESTDEPIIWCYGFRQDMVNLRLELGGDVPVLGGGTPTGKRVAIMDRWNKGGYRDMLLHPASAGHGIELQFGGRRMVWYCPTWSAELYAQTVKRIYRPGQLRPVFVHRITARGTVDDVKTARVENKIADELSFARMLVQARSPQDG